MQAGARLNSVIEVLDLVFSFEKPADGIVNNYVRSRRYIGSKDRRFITETVWHILRHYGRYRHLSSSLNGRLAVLLYLHFTHESVEALFSGEAYAPAVLTNEEKAFLKTLPEQLPSAAYECPEWLAEEIDENDIITLAQDAPLDLRVNTLKATVDNVLDALSKEGIPAFKTPFSPIGVRIEGRPLLSGLSFFQEGWADIQDEGSQIVSLLTRAEPNQTVMDWCAGAGGKTLALSAMMENKGTVYAADIDTRRLKDLPLRAQRAGVRNVILVSGYEHLKTYDLVLIDAPCSGIGTWRRAPDARWRMTKEHVDVLIKSQAEILDKAAPYVKKGGRLFYITCSLYQAENETQISHFLERHPEFSLEDLSSAYLSMTGHEAEMKMCYLKPSILRTDGFFAASMRKS